LATTQSALAGRHIVVTRPAGQADSLCEAISTRGGIPLCFPVLAIAAIADPTALNALSDRLDEFDLAFFVSPNAVHHALTPILARRPWPARVVVATVGKGSERALERFGFRAVVAPRSGFDSESVLSLAEFQPQAVRGKRIVIFRGDGGRDLLGETLRERGAQVEYVSCYHRFRPVADTAPLLDRARRGELDAITLTSSEGVGNLAAMAGVDGLGVLRGVAIFAPHPRIAAHARAAGFLSVIETPPGDDGLIHALESYFQ
jgi:uroporphyrinogen-III synthase